MSESGQTTDGGRRSASSSGTATLWNAFLAGFNVSGKGWNGEYPFQDHGRDPAANADLQRIFSRWQRAAESVGGTPRETSEQATEGDSGCPAVVGTVASTPRGEVSEGGRRPLQGAAGETPPVESLGSEQLSPRAEGRRTLVKVARTPEEGLKNEAPTRAYSNPPSLTSTTATGNRSLPDSTLLADYTDACEELYEALARVGRLEEALRRTIANAEIERDYEVIAAQARAALVRTGEEHGTEQGQMRGARVPRASGTEQAP